MKNPSKSWLPVVYTYYGWEIRKTLNWRICPELNTLKIFSFSGGFRGCSPIISKTICHVNSICDINIIPNKGIRLAADQKFILKISWVKNKKKNSFFYMNYCLVKHSKMKKKNYAKCTYANYFLTISMSQHILGAIFTNL